MSRRVSGKTSSIELQISMLKGLSRSHLPKTSSFSPLTALNCFVDWNSQFPTTISSSAISMIFPVWYLASSHLSSPIRGRSPARRKTIQPIWLIGEPPTSSSPQILSFWRSCTKVNATRGPSIWRPTSLWRNSARRVGDKPEVATTPWSKISWILRSSSPKSDCTQIGNDHARSDIFSLGFKEILESVSSDCDSMISMAESQVHYN